MVIPFPVTGVPYPPAALTSFAPPLKRPLSITLIGWPSFLSGVYTALTAPFTADSAEVRLLYEGAAVSARTAMWILWPFLVANSAVAWGILKGVRLIRPAWHALFIFNMLLSVILLGPEFKLMALFGLPGYVVIAVLMHTPLADRWFRGEPLPDDYPDYGTANAVLGLGMVGVGSFIVTMGLLMVTLFLGQIVPILFLLVATALVGGTFLYFGLRLMGPERLEIHIGGATYLVGASLLIIGFSMLLFTHLHTVVAIPLPTGMDFTRMIIGSSVLGVFLTGYGGYLLRS